MKMFENPEIEVIRFSAEDIMDGSTTTCSNDICWTDENMCWDDAYVCAVYA